MYSADTLFFIRYFVNIVSFLCSWNFLFHFCLILCFFFFVCVLSGRRAACVEGQERRGSRECQQGSRVSRRCSPAHRRRSAFRFVFPIFLCKYIFFWVLIGGLSAVPASTPSSSLRFAVIAISGTQHRVCVNDLVMTDRLHNEVGDELTYSPLLVGRFVLKISSVTHFSLRI
jgi:hypothetical protein